MSAATDAVLNSRAGDRFHYLWAARRCLKMIEPNTTLQHVWVEGSSDPNEAGELVIDLEERHVDESGTESFHYYQLKHSTVRLNKETVPSELASTLKGFAERHQNVPKTRKRPAKRFYHYISNRLVNQGLKQAVALLARGEKASKTIVRKLSAMTGLQETAMREFFALFSFHDQEKGYTQQADELRFDVARILAGTVEDGMTYHLLGLISDQALPKAKKSRTRGRIIQVDVLRVLGATHISDLFPARSAFEPLKKVFKRDQHSEIAKQIVDCPSGHAIIHAEGGVGKTVVAQQLLKAMPKHSFCLAYDCFGGGNYRSPSQPRHRPRDALMQMANEMALAGLCSVLIVPDRLAAPEIFKAFMQRVADACRVIQIRSSKALLVFFIDAADNAEMAAAEFNDASFTRLMLREKLPKNCRFVFLCRTERRKFLQPPSTTLQIRLLPFSIKETACHLKGQYPKASLMETKEFFRLTGGNPRVQSNCLHFASGSIREMLASLGSRQISVDQQIGNQLQSAIAKLRDIHPEMEKARIDAVCLGLAALPPFIPIVVLAAAARVEPETILSFVNDLGRPLWHTDQSVQFRDEPTETWFRQTFAATREDFSAYAIALEPLAATHTYAARSLPALWNQAEEHAKLIELALSDRFLPESSLIDARDVRIYRLQFALKAALKTGRMLDAAKLALRAGEEMAGNSRQLELLERNPDLMAALQDAQLVQECAYKRELKGTWTGSAEVYAASLLAWNMDVQGEANSCLQTATQWLHRYFIERDKVPERARPHQEGLQRSEIAELGWAHLGLYGAAGFCSFIMTWRPTDVIRKVTGIIVRRLVDSGKFTLIDSIAKHGAKSFPLLLALCDELNEIGKFPPKACLSHQLARFSGNEEELQETGHSLSKPNPFQKALLSFAEACVHHQFPSAKIKKLIERVGESTPRPYELTSDYNKVTRHTFARTLTLGVHLNGQPTPNAESLIPEPPDGFKEHEESRRERSDARKILGALLPLYELRAKMLAKAPGWEALGLLNIAEPSHATTDHDYYGRPSRIDSFWDEIPVLRLVILSMQNNVTDEDRQSVLKPLKQDRAAWHSLAPQIEMVRIAYHHARLNDLGQSIEEICQQNILKAKRPEDQGNDHWYIMMTRAVLAHSPVDAAAYFSQAVDETAKFGDELVTRWEAVSQIASASGEEGQNLEEIAYRYFSVAELVGMSVDREKYWSRSGVFKTLVWLHPPSSFTCLGRWMERGIGQQDHLLNSLFCEIVDSGKLSASAVFAVSAFEGLRASAHFLRSCLKAATTKMCRQLFFDQTAWDLYQANTLLSERKAMIEMAREHGLSLDYLSGLLVRMERIQPPKRIAADGFVQAPESPHTVQQESRVDLFAGCDLMTDRGMAKAIKIVTRSREYPQPRLEWSELMQRIPRGREIVFLETAISETEATYYDLKSIVGYTKRNWLTRVSVAHAWPALLQKMGRRFYAAFSELQCSSYCYDEFQYTDSEKESLHKGVMQQAEKSPTLLHSSALFGLATLAIKDLSPGESREVLDFALARFERHLTPEFGDGTWSHWLHPPADTLTAFSGWLWACLGNPDSAMRWEASHCVRRLVELDCQTEINSLLRWHDNAGVAAYLGKDFVFYKFQAQLHLLCGLARGALGQPAKLSPYLKEILSFGSTPHALIQWEASQLALAVEQAFPDTLSADELRVLQDLGQSPLTPRLAQRDDEFHSPWHQGGNHTWPEHLYFDMDFREYWMDSLCAIFGIPREELVDLLSEAAAQDMGVVCVGDYPEDARRSVWESMRGQSHTTYHSHGSYPAVYSYHFYYAFHSWMIVAAKLHKSMPMVKRDDTDWRESNWNEWLSSHRLVRDGGYWLSDRLDPLLPSRQPRNADSSTNWLYEVQAGDFYEALTAQASIPGGLCVYGHWHQPEYSRCETTAICSAFVSPEMASSLANALRHEKDVHFCSLNGIMNTEEDSVYDPAFQLSPFVDIHRNNESGLDKFDPHACGVNWQKDLLNSSLVSDFDLNADPLERFWHQTGHKDPALILESWSQDRGGRGESYSHSGNRLFASLDFLRLACRERKQSLVIEVEIRRTSERERVDDLDVSYLPPSKKVFILNENGHLQDSRTHYQLG